MNKQPKTQKQQITVDMSTVSALVAWVKKKFRYFLDGFPTDLDHAQPENETRCIWNVSPWDKSRYPTPVEAVRSLSDEPPEVGMYMTCKTKMDHGGEIDEIGYFWHWPNEPKFFMRYIKLMMDNIKEGVAEHPEIGHINGWGFIYYDKHLDNPCLNGCPNNIHRLVDNGYCSPLSPACSTYLVQLSRDRVKELGYTPKEEVLES